ncbi:MAG: glycosyltransferase family 2 protein [Treponema sp.]|nr:glycosyltransferase family 2 protein [Treponema sp.]
MDKDQMIFCILVTYNPDFSQIKATLDSLLSQVDEIIIVKNSNERFDFLDGNDCTAVSSAVHEKIHIIPLEKNMGIAYAQNRGIEYALAHGAEYVLFSDQDTIFPQDFVETSLACFERHTNEKVAAVVPHFYNENKKQFAQISVTKTKAVVPEIGKDYFLAHAISSGSVCPASVLKNAGMMNERLFIDWVDFEWCWRAAALGYKIICDTGNVIHHNMGDSFKSVLGRKIVVYSDFRQYFFLRNGFYLLFHSGLLRGKEKLSFGVFMLMKSVLYFVTSGFTWKHIKVFFKAVSKGITNRFSLEEEL